MTESDKIKSWFMEEFWPTYPARFCSKKSKGSRAIALKHMLKHKPGEKERVRILGNLKAQIRAHQKKPESEQKWWKNGETYCYNGLWEDEIESMMEVEQKSNKITVCKCGQLAHGPQYSECPDCLLERVDALPGDHRWLHKRKNVLMNLGLYSPGQSRSDVISRCKARGSLNGIFSLAYLLKISSTHGQQDQ
jgi:hypothetical protein